MARSEVPYAQHFSAVMRVMTGQGLLLASGAERPNAMTIGWGTIGSVWGKPMWIVLVRPSRYTYQLIEKAGDFTVNVPTKELARACAVCGSSSGRDMDKFKDCGLTAGKSRRVRAAFIEQCPMHYECKVVHSNDVAPASLAQEIRGSCYGGGDYHRVYWGEILGAYAEPHAEKEFGR